MLTKLASFYLLLNIAIITQATKNHRANDWSNGLTTTPINELSSTTSFIIKQHRLNKSQKKKSSNRNRAAVHKTTTLPVQSTTAMSEDEYFMRQFNLPDHVNVTVKVGDSIILNCAINSSYGINPGVIWMQGKLGNVLTLDTSRITADTRFEIIQLPLHQSISNDLVLNGTMKRSSNHHHHRHHNYRQVTQTDFNYYHLKINNVQIDDENEYACETSSTKHEEQSNVHALFNLHITQSPSFIEQLTSEINNAIFEYSDTVLKCFATGKPAPRIKWYQLSDENEILKDLFHESTILSIKNVSKNDPGRYECVASNGILPSVSKKFSITVYYSPTVIPLNNNVYQTVGQSVLLGCVVNSNPESTVVWYKKNKNLTNGTNDFESIDVSQSNYQIHKFKQTNQTVYYLKIKYLELNDYAEYKCEATNLVGKNEAVIEILDLQETEQYNINNDKTIKQNNQSISYVLNNPSYLDDDVDDKRTENDNDESEEFRSKTVLDNHKPKNTKENLNGTKKKQPAISMRKNSNNNSNNNRTYHKYQINKSNSIQESENSLQRINDILVNGSASVISFHSMFIYLLLLILLNLIFSF